MPARTVIRAGTLLDGTGDGPRYDAAIVIEGERIVGLESAREIAGAPGPDIDVIDASNQTVLPGLIDSHVHLCMDGQGQSKVSLRTADDTDVILAVLARAQTALRAGVTTLRDVGGKGMLTVTVREAIACGTVVGPRLVVCGRGITITGGHGHDLAIEADDEIEVRKAARQLFRDGADFIKLFGTGGNSTLSSNPRLAQYGVAEFRAVIEEARRIGKRVTTHVHGIPGIRNAVEAGVDSLEHALFMTADGRIEYDETLGARIAAQAIPVSLGIPTRWRNPTDALMAHLNPRQRAQRGQVQERLVAIRKMREAGVKLIASSDAGTPMTSVDQMPELLQFMTEHVGMSVPEAIHAATERPAEAMGLADELGTIAPGKIADLILVDGDPTRDILTLRNVTRVIRSGRTLVRDGFFTAPNGAMNVG